MVVLLALGHHLGSIKYLLDTTCDSLRVDIMASSYRAVAEYTCIFIHLYCYRFSQKLGHFIMTKLLILKSFQIYGIPH